VGAVSTALQSNLWFRVAPLKPRLKGHVRVHRHLYRGVVWYAVEDRAAGKHHRFNQATWRLLRQMDGRHSLQQLWDKLSAELHDQSPSQDDIVQLLGQLHGADLVGFDVTPDVAELLTRRDKQDRQRWMSRLLNPLSLRFPMWDPDAFLGHLVHWLAPLRGWLSWGLWLALVLSALVLVPAHWAELTRNVSDRLFSVDNLWVMALAFPLLKGVHELAHGWAVKLRGGEVHEMGLMLLMFYPVPYVDASSAHAFQDKRDRVRVGAAGMVAELAVAALAFHMWLLLEPGLARSVAYNMVLLGSLTTVLFNANPLMRYDGYFILQDLIEVPNLGQRANQYWQYLLTRHAFGALQQTPPASSLVERRIFLVYAPLAWVYRLSVTLGIAWLVAQHYFVFGVLMALWALASGLLIPAIKGLRTLFTKPPYTSRRGRVWGVLGGTLATTLALFFVLPMPHHTTAQGVVSLPDGAVLRAGTDGFVTQVRYAAGATVSPADVVLDTRQPSLQAKVDEQAARQEEAQARLDAAWGQNPAEAGRLNEKLKSETAALERLTDEAAQLSLRPRAQGRLLLDQAQDLPGRFVHKGEVLGHVVGQHQPVLKVVVSQDDVDQVSHGTRDVEVRLPQALDVIWSAQMHRAVPKAGHDLPSAALSHTGGGPFVPDARNDKGTQVVDTVFELELQLPDALRQSAAQLLGSRAYVRFEHPPEPLGWRWLRKLRRQFLSNLQW
jgi:putative peptide zinc metalloprotease protein